MEERREKKGRRHAPAQLLREHLEGLDRRVGRERLQVASKKVRRLDVGRGRAGGRHGAPGADDPLASVGPCSRSSRPWRRGAASPSLRAPPNAVLPRSLRCRPHRVRSPPATPRPIRIIQPDVTHTHSRSHLALMRVVERPGRAVQVMVPRSKCDELVERSNNGKENREEEGGPKKQRKHYTTLLTRFGRGGEVPLSICWAHERGRQLSFPGGSGTSEVILVRVRVVEASGLDLPTCWCGGARVARAKSQTKRGTEGERAGRYARSPRVRTRDSPSATRTFLTVVTVQLSLEMPQSARVWSSMHSFPLSTHVSQGSSKPSRRRSSCFAGHDMRVLTICSTSPT